MMSHPRNNRSLIFRPRLRRWCPLGGLLLALAVLAGCAADPQGKAPGARVLPRGVLPGRVLGHGHAAPWPLPPPCYGYHADAWRPWPCPDLFYEPVPADEMPGEPMPDEEATPPMSEEPAGPAPGESGVRSSLRDRAPEEVTHRLRSFD